MRRQLLTALVTTIIMCAVCIRVYLLVPRLILEVWILLFALMIWLICGLFTKKGDSLDE